MKKILSSLLVLSLFGAAVAQSDIPDGGFENWTDKGSYIDYGTDLLMTLNGLYDMNGDEMETALTAFRESNAYEGNYAIRLTSVWFGGDVIFVPGALATLNEPETDNYVSDFLNLHHIKLTESYEFKPWRLTGYYKYAPVNGDSAAIELKFYQQNGNVLSTCEKYVITEAADQWTPFDITTGLQNSIYGVAEISLVFASSAAYDFADLEQCEGQAGSSLYLDGLAFRYDNEPLGLIEPLIPVVKTSVYPNPTTENVNFDFNKDVNANLVIYNINGQQIATSQINGNHAEYNASALANGTYLYRIIDGNTILSSGKFAVAK